MKTETEHLADLSEVVRESSLKRFRRVKPGDEGWRPTPRTLSFVDQLKHLVDADEWLFRTLDGVPSNRPAIAPGDAPPARWHDLLASFCKTGQRRAEFLRSITPEQLANAAVDPEALGQTEWYWIIASANMDHEVHHRGAMQLALRLRYDPADTA